MIRWFISCVCLFLGSMVTLYAGEGMWVPVLLEQTRYEEMKSLGLQLSAKDIYDINHASMKDAVVLFNGGCSGVVVSGEGLLLTNHHCGYDRIQAHSTLEHDYLTEGFWAGSHEEELPNPGLEVDFLIEMEDVTDAVLALVGDTMTESERWQTIKEGTPEIAKKSLPSGKGYKAVIKSLFNGNQYYLYVYQTYKDVRLVGAPPSSIGKFGGDTDNWIWPRHTGDFSVFRIYAGKDNQPAEYSPENIPYKPAYFVPVSLRGLSSGDFSMVMGYPGSTDRFITSPELSVLVDVNYPLRIALRNIKLDIWKQAMKQDPLTRIQYAAKYASVSNAWKKWQGVIRGIEKAGGIEQKKAAEKLFLEKIRTNPQWNTRYAGLPEAFEKTCEVQREYIVPSILIQEGIFGVEWMQMAEKICRFVESLPSGDENSWTSLLNAFISDQSSFYRNYRPEVDREVFAALLTEFMKNADSRYIPAALQKTLDKKFHGDIFLYVKDLYDHSVLKDQSSLSKALLKAKSGHAGKVFNLPEIALYKAFDRVFLEKIEPVSQSVDRRLDSLTRIYTEALLLLNADQPVYPDANLTLRVAYGSIEGFSPSDAVLYTPFTYLDGVIAKEDTSIYDYKVPARLKALYEARDYGDYGVGGRLPVCMLGSNHTSGGNSGSPVFNRNGELVGLNFDRNWEGTMSDVLYDPEQCRNIMVDIRYVLFIIDKFAGSKHLVSEMQIVK